MTPSQYQCYALTVPPGFVEKDELSLLLKSLDLHNTTVAHRVLDFPASLSDNVEFELLSVRAVSSYEKLPYSD
jgi:hypothetical protein